MITYFRDNNKIEDKENKKKRNKKWI
jgi:hypothetical protein